MADGLPRQDSAVLPPGGGPGPQWRARADLRPRPQAPCARRFGPGARRLAAGDRRLGSRLAGREEGVVVSDDSRVHVFTSAGRLLPGWPRKVETASNTGPTLVDLDGAP